jgi:hypothetical protein
LCVHNTNIDTYGLLQAPDIVEILGSLPYSSSPLQRKIRTRRVAFGAGDADPTIIKGNRMNPLTTVKWPLIIGFALAVLIAVLGGRADLRRGESASLTRWLHIVFGVFWIGLLYYFNAVQTPAMAVAAADKGGPGGAGINKYVAPRALLWFRWSALGTWLLGAYLLSQTPGRFISAFTFGLTQSPPPHANRHHGLRRLVRNHHAAQCLGDHLAEPEENPGYRAGHRRTEGSRAQGRSIRLAHQLPAVHSHADVHGGGRSRAILGT